MDHKQVIAETVKVLPPVAVTIFGVSLDDWVKIATLVFIIFQMAVALIRLRRQEAAHV